MSGTKSRATTESALQDALVRIRRLERLIRSHPTPNIHFRQNLDGVTIDHTSTDTQKISFGTLLLPPINNGGTVDTNVFDVTGGGPWTDITILEPGLYWAEARIGWYRDWGKVRINLQYEHTNGESFPVSDSYGYTDSMPSEPGVTFTPIGTESHEQTAVARRGFIIIDEYAFFSSGIVKLFATVTNTSGSDRTYNNSTNVGGATLFIVQLNSGISAHANPIGV